MMEKNMSKDWVKDMHDMHDKYGVHDWMKANKDNKELMRKFLEFRIKFLEEELGETREALGNDDAEELVDGLIDLCVIAIGTLDAFGIDSHKAWNQVFDANMNKEVGVKESRPNPLGLPDLIKPNGWVGPDHGDNHGNLSDAI